MSDIKTAKYIESKDGQNVLKEGHTMFYFDIVKGLNRKSYLEELTVNQQEEIKRLKVLITEREQTIDGLSAQVEHVKKVAVDWVTEHSIELGLELDKTPQQCLADARSDAVDEFIKLVTNKHGNALTQPRLIVCAQQLRNGNG